MPTNTWTDLPDRSAGERYDFQKVNNLQNNVYYIKTAFDVEHSTSPQGYHKLIRTAAVNTGDSPTPDTADSIILQFETRIDANVTTTDPATEYGPVALTGDEYDFRDRLIVIYGLLCENSRRPGNSNDRHIWISIFGAGTYASIMRPSTSSYGYSMPIYGIFYTETGSTVATTVVADLEPYTYVYNWGNSSDIVIVCGTDGKLYLTGTSTSATSSTNGYWGGASSASSSVVSGLIVAGPVQNHYSS
jgi:hypothetical protein